MFSEIPLPDFDGVTAARNRNTLQRKLVDVIFWKQWAYRSTVLLTYMK